MTALLQNQPEIVEALTAAENITILAPSNAAFEKFLAANPGAADQADVVAALLQYHVLGALVPSTGFSETPAYVATLLTDPMYTNVTGGQVVEGVAKDGGVSVFSGGRAESKVETADVTFDGGVVHVIDTVLTIPGSIADAATAANLSSLAEAVVATNLLSVVEGIEDITLFAPTNEAFAAIADVAATLSPEELAAVLQYHVVAGTVAYSGELESGEVETANGASINIEVSDSGVKVNDATVVVADVLVANGVVHVIDAYVFLLDQTRPFTNSSPVFSSQRLLITPLPPPLVAQPQLALMEPQPPPSLVLLPAQP